MLCRRKPATAIVLIISIWSIGLSIVSTILAERTVEARELQGRIGAGFNNQFSNSTAILRVPGFSIKYALTRDIAVEGIFAIATTSPSSSATAIKFFKNMFYETNLNFYGLFGAGIVSADGHSGAEFIGGLGAEFFIPGLESLGMSVEMGGSFSNVTGSFVIKTMGVSFLDAGIHFYF